MALAEVLEHGGTRPNVLIVTIKSAIGVWQSHIERMFFDFDYYSPRSRWSEIRDVMKERNRPAFVVVNHDQLRINKDLQKVTWDYCIVDESQAFNNRKAQRTKGLKKIKAHNKRAMSGTPMINRPDDLWSILHWLYPKNFSSYWRFFEDYCAYTTEYGPQGAYKVVTGCRNESQLRAIMSPFFLRRVKKDVMPELPDKYYSQVHVDLLPEQKRAYKQMKEEALAWVGQYGDEPVPAPVAIAQLTRLRQFAVAYAEVDEDELQTFDGDAHKIITRVTLREPSSKLDALMEIIENTDQQIVVFSQFAQLVYLAIERFKKAGISYGVITGKVSTQSRTDAIEKFQKGDSRVFISTIKSGGAGITLTAASTVVFLDRSWSPADNWQAEDRLHRRGQNNAVHVINIVARDTVDHAIDATLSHKADLIRKIIEA